jgi:hypothetical protein
VDRPSLEDIYLSLTAAQDAAAAEEVAAPRRGMGRRG